jgi:hypothetical protein
MEETEAVSQQKTQPIHQQMVGLGLFTPAEYA